MHESSVRARCSLRIGLLLTAFPWPLLTIGTGGCTDLFQNQTGSLGGDTAGDRGTVQVLFINNTPYRAVFTFGNYDQLDQDSGPDFDQFGLRESDPNLDGDMESGFVELACGRVFSVGGPQLIALIEDQLDDDSEIVEEALIEGVEFFALPDEGSDDDPVSQGFAQPLEALISVDFPCGALLIVYFEIADAGPDPFRIDFELVPSESTR